MLIDNNDIKKAKENLGDKNAILMAELLELDNFDEKTLTNDFDNNTDIT